MRKLVVPLVILTMLVTVMMFRFNAEASKSGGDSSCSYVIKWERDRWTGDLWMKAYGFSKSGSMDGMVVSGENLTDDQKNETLQLRKSLTNIWWGLVVADLFWMAIIIIRNKKEKPYDPVLETYKKLFPEE
ncbi:MAG: hypothetical protein PHE79_08565 [Eubacteriales bacterium]|nr:hypothetical protein [Eubacteriales bacterium]